MKQTFGKKISIRSRKCEENLRKSVGSERDFLSVPIFTCIESLTFEILLF